MSIKDDVLSVLMESEAPVSGERLARRLCVSRNTIWKAIGLLRQEGYVIQAATNRGYQLMESPDRINESGIRKWLGDGMIGSCMEIHERLDSTNNRAKQMAAGGAAHGMLVIAESQEQGRGRFGRTFFSPEHSGIYMTYILRPDVTADRAVMITSLTAVAVARAIEAVANVEVKIKWVNDLFINGRKVCGILCEAGMDFESGQLEYAVVGIGINTAPMEFPEALREIATSIGNECGHTICRNRLIAEISNQLNHLYPDLERADFMRESRARSMVIGRDVLVLRGGESFEAHVVDIDERGNLVVQTAEGIKHIGSGEISLKMR